MHQQLSQPQKKPLRQTLWVVVVAFLNVSPGVLIIPERMILF